MLQVLGAIPALDAREGAEPPGVVERVAYRAGEEFAGGASTAEDGWVGHLVCEQLNFRPGKNVGGGGCHVDVPPWGRPTSWGPEV